MPHDEVREVQPRQRSNDDRMHTDDDASKLVPTRTKATNVIMISSPLLQMLALPAGVIPKESLVDLRRTQGLLTSCQQLAEPMARPLKQGHDPPLMSCSVRMQGS